MIKMEKLGNEISPDIKLSDGVNSFMIARNNLPDPCWYPNINYFTNNDNITFTIKEEDGNIYILFNKLYQDVIDGNIYPLTMEDIKGKSSEDVRRLKREKEKEKAEYREIAERTGLVDNGVINWHSEDYDAYEYASILTIKRVDKQIEITFSKNKENPDEDFPRTHPTYSVRITESGGRYWPFYMIFVNFRCQLQALNLGKNNLETNSVPEIHDKVFSKKQQF